MANPEGGALKRKKCEMGSSMEADSSMSSPECSSPASNSNGSAGKMIPSPARKAQNTAANWLRADVSPLPSKPSAELEKFFSLGSRNIAHEVVGGANIVLEAIFPGVGLGERPVAWSLLNVNLMDSLWSGHERIEALKLYYKVLESICTSEAEKSSSRDLSGFLTNEKFHRCLLACSAELVSMACTKISILFQLILERAGITAFDMCKVIESFVKHEGSLPGELRRHLNKLEETMLESMVWEKGSSLYNSLVVSRLDLSDRIKQLKLLAEPMLSLDAISMNNHVAHQHNSSVTALKDVSPAVNGVQMKPLPVSPTSRTLDVSRRQSKSAKEGSAKMDAAVTMIFNKMTKLAAVRLNSMAERLKLSRYIREKTYFLFRQILTEKTYLFFNRHIDLIILCCLYGISKIYNLELTFKEITTSYTKEPQCRYQCVSFVLSVWLSKHNGENGENCDNIAAFYNRIFIPNVASLLKEISSTGASKQALEAKDCDIRPSTPQQSPFPRVPDISPKKVSPSQNIYLSPLRPSKKDGMSSHVGRSYYAFIGERTCAYQSPSKDLDVINKCLNSCAVLASCSSNLKRRRMLDFSDGNVTVISDSDVARSLFGNNEGS